MTLEGVVKWFNTKKGYGFITVLTPDSEYLDKNVFIHFSNLNISSNNYKSLYPGEYVSFNIGKNTKGEDICIDVMGIHGGPLLADNAEYRYKVFPRMRREDVEKVDSTKEDSTKEED